MFGYIRVFKPEMKVKDFEIYNAIYCGLCRELGRSYGPLSKFCLSYDMTFISLVQAALDEEAPCFEQKCCRVNPLKKCTYCKSDSKTQSLAAAASVALCDMKVLDNVEDSSFLVSLFWRFLRLFTKKWCKKAFKNYPQLKPVIEEYIEGQRLAESNRECGLDEAAEPTARAVAEILKMAGIDPKYDFVLERMGYCLGKWVYLCDVADDIEKDIKKGRFNPLIGQLPDGKTPIIFAEERLTPIMNNCFSECANYSELLETKKFKPILDNILYDGLRARQKLIFNKEKCKK